NSDAQISVSGREITGATDQDWYKVTVPDSTTGTMTVTMQASNFSSLAPRVTVFNASGQGLAQAIDTNCGGKATLSISNGSPGQVYYVRAIAGMTGPGSVGAYGLQVNFGSKVQAPIPGLITIVASRPDQPGTPRSSADTGSNDNSGSGSRWHDGSGGG